MANNSLHPTLSQVGRAAGVGCATVSRVINGGDHVSPETLAHVLRVIETLGYVPNQAARILKGHRTKTIGLVVPSIADPFFSSCAEAVQAIARAHESLLIVTATDNDTHNEIESLNALMRQRVDGLILVPSNIQSQALSDILDRATMPVVAIDRPLRNSSIHSVVADNSKGASAATKHLIDHGYKRIVCLTGESSLYTIRERMSGYRKAMEAANLEPVFDTTIKDYPSTEAAIRRILESKNPPQAIFATKNKTTIYALEALLKFNVSIPKSMALIGYDDFELASTVRPSISVIEQPVEEIGRRAAMILFEQMAERLEKPSPETSTRTRIVKLKTRLIARSSCGCNPQDMR
jgi:LacI family transcriptional regulator